MHLQVSVQDHQVAVLQAGLALIAKVSETIFSIIYIYM